MVLSTSTFEVQSQSAQVRTCPSVFADIAAEHSKFMLLLNNAESAVASKGPKSVYIHCLYCSVYRSYKKSGAANVV